MSVRSELNLRPVEPLDPRGLASWLEVPVHPISDLDGEGIGASIQHFMGPGQQMFSAVTIFPDYPGHRRVILYNDANTPARQNSDIAHELAHGLLLHEPRLAIVNGCRDYNKDEEDEARWLSGCLLIPRKAALRIARSRATKASLKNEYGVSEEMFEWRIRMTGARTQVARERNKQNRQ